MQNIWRSATLVILVGAVLYGCKKNSAPIPAIHILKMAGTHQWHGTVRIHSYNVAVDTVDTVNYTFSIIVLNDSTIKCGFHPSTTETLYYSPSFSNDSELIFWADYSYPNKYQGTSSHFTVDFNFLTNSIELEKYIGYPMMYQDTILYAN